ncbi:MAG TPA: hypothetical protein VGH27_28680 [Streptosporangiaceae bacterium]
MQSFSRAGLSDDVFLTGAGSWRPAWPNVAFWDEECPFLWHKERLLNIGARGLPAKYTHVVWADSDIIVGPDWAPAVRAAFEQAPIVQCFSTVVSRTDTGANSPPRPSALRPDPGGVGGICWGAERSLFSGGPGLFDLALAGGADSIFASELLGANALPSVPWLVDHPALLHQSWSAPLIARLDQWRAAARDWAAGKKAVAADATIDVIVHGPVRERRYFDRQPLLAQLSPSRHLICEPGRVFGWSADGLAEVEPAIRAYFHGRREDDALIGRG